MGLHTLDLKLLVQAVILSGIPLAIWLIPKVSIILPLVILQLAVGIIVGPSVMGEFWPEFEAWLFSPDALFGLNALATWGVTFFVFYTGLHIEKEMFFGPRATMEFWVLALSSLFFPFGIGCLIGWLLLDVWFDHSLLGPDGTEVTYILSIGVCVGVTALPVLSAILMEIGQLESDLGILMIACATVHDVLLWVLITLIFGLAKGEDNWAGVYQPLASLGLIIVLILFLGFVYSPLMVRLIRTSWWQTLSAVPRLTINLVMMYFSAIGSEVLQVHTLVGVVAFGACVPLTEKPFVMGHIDIMNRALFLPLFFGNAGLKVRLNQATANTGWIFLALLVGAIIGQIPGSLLVARFFKRSWKQACIMSAFMLCKGGVGIIVATLLLARGVVNGDTFSGIMMMALACTAVTKPIILLCQKCMPGTENPFQLTKLPTLAVAPCLSEHGSLKDFHDPEAHEDGPSSSFHQEPDVDSQNASSSAPNPYLFLTHQPSQAPFYQSTPELSVPHQSLADFSEMEMSFGKEPRIQIY